MHTSVRAHLRFMYVCVKCLLNEMIGDYVEDKLGEGDLVTGQIFRTHSSTRTPVHIQLIHNTSGSLLQVLAGLNKHPKENLHH